MMVSGWLFFLVKFLALANSSSRLESWN